MRREKREKDEKNKSGLTASRARGIMALIGVLFLFQVGILIYNKFFKSETKYSEKYGDDKLLPNISNKNKIEPEIFFFDPNTIPVDSLCLLGLSYKQAQTIDKYRSKGGKFRKKEDFAKMYTVSDAFYKRVENYILIANHINGSVKIKSDTAGVRGEAKNRTENNSHNERKNGFEYKNRSRIRSVSEKEREKEQEREKGKRLNSKDTIAEKPLDQRVETSKTINEKYSSIDLNKADSVQLVSLYGIGPYFAKKIMEYRDRLGSFAYVEQLLEVRGIDEERFSSLIDRITIDENNIRRFSLDTVSVEFMKKHPYIGAYAAQGIILLRDLKNKGEKVVHITPQILLEEKILNSEQVRKLMMYCR